MALAEDVEQQDADKACILTLCFVISASKFRAGVSVVDAMLDRIKVGEPRWPNVIPVIVFKVANW